jgi:hypothetical protein
VLGGIQQGQQVSQGQNILEQQRLGQQQAQLQAQQQQQASALARRGAAGEQIQTGAELAQLFVDRPDLAKQVHASAGARTEFQKNDLAQFGFRLEQAQSPEEQQQIIQQRVSDVTARGGNAQDSAALLTASPQQIGKFARTVQIAALSNPERLEIAQGGRKGLASAKTEFLPGGGSIQALPNEKIVVKDEQGRVVEGQDRVALFRRSNAFQLSLAQGRADISVDAETKKAAAKAGVELETKPEIEAAVAQAVSTIRTATAAAGEQKSNQVTLNSYTTAMKGLVDALAGTDTGPFVGLLPALTANQQIAEGAIAAISPILKNVFRGAGEGTFTDADQALLTAMIPTRKDKPAARRSKLQNIDAIVRAKLNVPTTGTPPPPAPAATIPATTPTAPTVLQFDAQGNLVQ